MKQRRVFSEAFKREKVKLLEKADLKVTELSALYEVSKSAIYKWKRKYGSEPSETIVVQKTSEATKNIALLKQIASLEQLIGQMQLKQHYLESVISCGSELIGEDLKKKSTTPVHLKSNSYSTAYYE